MLKILKSGVLETGIPEKEGDNTFCFFLEKKHMSDLPQLLKRLEAVTGRLEGLANGQKAVSSPDPAAASGDGKASPMLDSFDEILAGPFTKFVDLSKTIGGLVSDQVHFCFTRGNFNCIGCFG
jgi:hypothetical protein